MTETYIDVKPGTYAKPQRMEASAKAAEVGRGLHMAVGNSMTRYWADSTVPVGKVMITMPLTYKGIPEYIKTLDSPEQEWCPREKEHAEDKPCMWCATEPTKGTADV